MNVGAVIVAAGMSSRMGGFKPMLSIGSISVARRIIATLQQAGAERIVVVTGYRADELERHLSGSGVVFLRNEEYAETQMFDSAKLGLSYLADKCSHILFTPVDIPLFTAATVKALLQSGAPLACPVCGEKTGHPLLLSASLVPSILADSGEGGLQGAISRLSQPMVLVPVDDPGTLHDMDTPADYQTLLDLHNRQLVRPLLRVSLAREVPFFDESIAMLLRMVDETGSVRSACQRIQMSYSKGWSIIRTLESQLSYPLVTRSQGGAGGGQSALTPEGKRLLEVYQRFSAELHRRAAALYSQYFDGLI